MGVLMVAVTVLATACASDETSPTTGVLSWPLEQEPAAAPPDNPAMALNLSETGWVSVDEGAVVAGMATSPDGDLCVVGADPEQGPTASACSAPDELGPYRLAIGIGERGGYDILGNLPRDAVTVTVDGKTVTIAGDVIVVPRSADRGEIAVNDADGVAIDWD